jgi:hypothetical protein
VACRRPFTRRRHECRCSEARNLRPVERDRGLDRRLPHDEASHGDVVSELQHGFGYRAGRQVQLTGRLLRCRPSPLTVAVTVTWPAGASSMRKGGEASIASRDEEPSSAPTAVTDAKTVSSPRQAADLARARRSAGAQGQAERLPGLLRRCRPCRFGRWLCGHMAAWNQALEVKRPLAVPARVWNGGSADSFDHRN